MVACVTVGASVTVGRESRSECHGRASVSARVSRVCKSVATWYCYKSGFFQTMAAMATDTPSPASGMSQHQTNVRHSTVVQSPSSATSHPSLNQDVMKTQMQREVHRATFLVDLTAEGAPFHADSDTVQLVLGRLRDHYGITSTTLFSNDDSSVDNPRFPPKGFQRERLSYIPLTHFLNTIVRATNDCLPPGPRYLKDMHFLHYGREMEGIYNSHRPLKPDALGLFRLPQSPEQKFSWNLNEVAMIVEVKDQIADSILQLATYGRCYLAADRRRSFALAIAFSHKSLEICFFVFHRSGLSSSGPISLRTPEGFQTAVKYMVGIMSIPDEEAFGMDMTRREDVYRINDRNYRIVRPICVRNSVRGRATFVCSLKCAQIFILFIHIRLTCCISIQYTLQKPKMIRST